VHIVLLLLTNLSRVQSLPTDACVALSQLLIQAYLNELSDLRRVSGTTRETVVREAFKTLLKSWGRALDLIFVPEYEYITPARDRRQIDGALLHTVRVPLGYWEAKDEKDDLDDEIEFKFRRGYPQDNIILDDSRTAVLIQNRQEVMRCDVDDVTNLEKLLGLFFSYERPEIAEFRKAVEQFKIDLPAVLTALRAMIEQAERENSSFLEAATKFLTHARETINPSVTAADVREMLIQHILTEDIFSQIFGDSDFHRQNNVAKELYTLEGTFFVGGLKRKTLEAMKPYYAAIRSAAALVSSHHEKQAFLKVIYENFYRIYNPKAADRLGVVYTPNEIVRFMIDGADWLCQKHFGKRLIDQGVEILDPAAGTGTFVTEMIEHFRGQIQKLKYKYLEELHANEVGILPYYVANLNIEATYGAVAQEYQEYPNLCFVDTLDNLGWSRTKDSTGAIGDLFGALSDENVKRITRQNQRKISVVIGNPPYNANQLNENDNNKNRIYPAIDKRIKQTYIASSHAQKTKQYDMFVRFFRWASDRLNENGIVAFITNRGFLDKHNFDGFRKTIPTEFESIYVVDLGGSWREKGIAGGGNVFGIGTGVAISFCVKRYPRASKPSQIKYFYPPSREADEKLSWLSASHLGELKGDEITPDSDGNWLNQIVPDRSASIPVASKSAKATKIISQANVIFRTFSLGVSTNRDHWLYDVDAEQLERKVRYLIAEYDKVSPKAESFPDTIKWSETLKRRKAAATKEIFGAHLIRAAAYRPYFKNWLYQSPLFIDRPSLADEVFPPGEQNPSIVFTDPHGQKPWFACATNCITDLHFVGASAGAIILNRYRFLKTGRIDNITDFALNEFQANYMKDKPTKRAITKDAIFYYTYGVLHDPIYRQKYALNLKREFPRIPFYVDFWRWVDWGERLLSLHIGYETVNPWPIERIDVPDAASKSAGLPPKLLMRVNKPAGNIEIDNETQLAGIPIKVWDYKLGDRSSLEWILDEYKPSKPKDQKIREKFNLYTFSDHKEHVIDLLKRVTRVSVETMEIVSAMEEANGAR